MQKKIRHLTLILIFSVFSFIEYTFSESLPLLPLWCKRDAGPLLCWSTHVSSREIKLGRCSSLPVWFWQKSGREPLQWKLSSIRCQYVFITITVSSSFSHTDSLETSSLDVIVMWENAYVQTIYGWVTLVCATFYPVELYLSVWLLFLFRYQGCFIQQLVRLCS